MAILTTICAKCGRQLSEPAIEPAYCAKCDLINSLIVERYTVYERKTPDNPENS